MLVSVTLILTGFVLLAKGAELLVEGACAIARRYRVPDLVIGLTVVALGTSSPELVVCLVSAARGTDGITIGNIMGSNIANLCLVLGVAGLLMPVTIARGTVWKEIPFCVATSVLLLVIVSLFNRTHLVTRWESLVLLGVLGAYLFFMFRAAQEPPTGTPRQRTSGIAASAAMVGIGLAGLMLGGELIVRNCTALAARFGLSEGVVGVTIVAIGTSLPELATSVTSILKGKADIAVGNVVGSNILNTCFVLGASAMIRPVDAPATFSVDALVAVAASIALFFFMFTGKKLKVDRWEAVLFLSMYVAYMGFAVYRR